MAMVRLPKNIQWWWSSQKPLKRHWNQWLGSPKTMVIVQRCQNHWGCAKHPERLINTSHCQQHEWFPSGLWHRGRGEQPAGKLGQRIPTGSGRSAHCRGHLRTCQPSKSQLLANIKKLKGRCSAHDNHRNLLIFLYWPTIQITIELKFVMEDDDHDSRQDRDDQKRVENHGVMMMLWEEKADYHYQDHLCVHSVPHSLIRIDATESSTRSSFCPFTFDSGDGGEN